MTSESSHNVFASSLQYWIGIDTDPDASSADLEAFNKFYDEIHVHEVMDRNGFVQAARYRLEVPDSRGDLGPMWLACYGFADEAAAEQYLQRESGTAQRRGDYTPGPELWRSMSARWRLLWRPVFAVGDRHQTPDRIFVVGIDPAPGCSPTELEEFDTFYRETHVPEVVEYCGFAAGTRLDLHEALLHPDPPGCPRFSAVYEGALPPPGTVSLDQYSSGPPSWEQRVTKWRLCYQLVTETRTPGQR